MNFVLYVSLGDSMSIDDYAGRGLGAASLLYRNDDTLWPEFRGRDLVHAKADCRFLPKARNGAMLKHVQAQVAELEPLDEPTLVTMTVGGNDLLSGLGASPSWPLAGFAAELSQVLARLRELFPQLTLLVGNVYDPGEGTGVVQSGHDMFSSQLARLPALNELLRTTALMHEGVPVDIWSHFRGHAIGDDEWIFCDIEPTKRGSSEIRRLWWDAVTDPGANSSRTDLLQ